MKKDFKMPKLGFHIILYFLISWFGCENKGGNNVAEAQTNTTIRYLVDSSSVNHYSWLTEKGKIENNLINRISTPSGFERLQAPTNSFADWLRHLPLKPGKPDVMLYNGEPKNNQSAHFAVLNIDVGKEDLQQCADAVMRLQSEYHYSIQEYEKIHFNFTSGHEALYSKWKEGYRPKINGSKVTWTKSAEPSNTYKIFRSYLRQVFMYAGSSSLSKELTPVSLADLKIGDIFIRGGFPGHAVIILDVAINTMTKEKQFVLAQSYMPAQDIHILLNPATQNAPWFSLPEGSLLVTPEWTFERSELKRFK